MNKPTVEFINSTLYKNDPANVKSPDASEYLSEAKQIYQRWEQRPLKDLILSTLEESFCYCVTLAQAEMMDKGFPVSRRDMYFQPMKFSNVDKIVEDLRNAS